MSVASSCCESPFLGNLAYPRKSRLYSIDTAIHTGASWVLPRHTPVDVVSKRYYLPFPPSTQVFASSKAVKPTTFMSIMGREFCAA
jgi:hypothetical protein